MTPDDAFAPIVIPRVAHIRIAFASVFPQAGSRHADEAVQSAVASAEALFCRA